MDDVIFEEFKGTGNMELVLDRRSAERRLYPAIDVQRSATRKEELLLDPGVLHKVYLLRQYLADLSGVNALAFLLERLKRTPTNQALLASIFFPRRGAVTSNHGASNDSGW
jgi:transcription termination factor Rho